MCLSIAIGEKGAVYTSGWTSAQNFPTTPGVYDETHNGATDVFIVKFSNDLKKMYASTVVGGSGRDRWNQLILHKNGKVYVTGATEAYTTVKYNAEGEEVWMTRYKGPKEEEFDVPVAIALDESGNLYVTGNSPGPGRGTDITTVKYPNP